MVALKYVLAAALAASLGLSDGVANADPVKIRIGWVVVPANLAPILFEKPGIALHVGKSYTVENFHFVAAERSFHCKKFPFRSNASERIHRARKY